MSRDFRSLRLSSGARVRENLHLFVTQLDHVQTKASGMRPFPDSAVSGSSTAAEVRSSAAEVRLSEAGRGTGRNVDVKISDDVRA